MSTNLVPQDLTNKIESVLLDGDLSKLNAQERLSYYKMVCDSVGLNYLTKPFDYIMLNGRLTLYARKDATDQLRKIHNISVTISAREVVDDCYVVTAQAKTPTGRTDESIGAVAIGNLKGDAKCNALMKSETKAKRRVTLSICGLGMLDETEIETIPSAHPHSDAPVPTQPVTFTRKVTSGSENTPVIAPPVTTSTISNPVLTRTELEPVKTATASVKEALIETQRPQPRDMEQAQLQVGVEAAIQALRGQPELEPESGEYITMGQRRNLHREFKEALPEHLRKDVETILGAWLVTSGFYEVVGEGPNAVRKGTTKNIEAHLFEETKKKALLYASKCK